MDLPTNRTFNPLSLSSGDRERSLVSFLPEAPTAETPVLLGGRLSNRIATEELLERVEAYHSLTQSPNSFALKSEGEVWHGSGGSSLRTAVGEADGEGTLVDLARVGDNTLMSLTATLSDGFADGVRLSYLSDGFPEHHDRLVEWASTIGVADLAHTTSQAAPSVTVRYSRAQGKAPSLTVRRHIVDRDARKVVGAVVENPLRERELLGGLGRVNEPELELGDSTGATGHPSQFTTQTIERLREPDSLFVRTEVEHDLDAGHEFVLSRLTVSQLSPLYGGKDVWNVDAVARPRDSNEKQLPPSRDS